MNITICFDKLEPAPWVQGLQQAFPKASVFAWAPGAPAADHAIVWAPPQQFIDEHPTAAEDFVRATMLGLADAIDDPEAAAQISGDSLKGTAPSCRWCCW